MGRLRTDFALGDTGAAADTGQVELQPRLFFGVFSSRITESRMGACSLAGVLWRPAEGIGCAQK